MKHRNKFIYVFALLVMGLSSCLKDELVEDQKYGIINADVNKVVEFPSEAHTEAVALPLKDIDTVVNYVTIRLAAKEPAKEDVTVQLGLSGSEKLIDNYNHEHETEFEELPANLYSLTESALKVTIPKGSNTGVLKLKVNPGKFDPAITYALGLNIESVDNPGYIVSGNFDSILVRISAKNKYDGNYEVTATSPFVDITNAAFTGYYPLNSDLVTVSGNAVKMFCYTYLQGLEGHPFKNNGANSYYGNFAPIFTMDDTGKVISVTNYYGQGTNSSTRAAALDPTGVNRFTVNGSTKTLEVSYIMVQGGVDRTFFKEKWVFKGDR